MTGYRKAILIVLCFFGIFYTPLKLKHMFVITGRLPGRKLVPAVVVRKWQSEGSHGIQDYNLTFEVDDRNGRVERTEQLQEEAWQNAVVGSTFQAILADGSYYHPGSVYIEPGNFTFDWVLLMVEIGGVCYIGYRLYRSSQPVKSIPRQPVPRQTRQTRW